MSNPGNDIPSIGGQYVRPTISREVPQIGGKPEFQFYMAVRKLLEGEFSQKAVNVPPFDQQEIVTVMTGLKELGDKGYDVNNAFRNLVRLPFCILPYETRTADVVVPEWQYTTTFTGDNREVRRYNVHYPIAIGVNGEVRIKIHNSQRSHTFSLTQITEPISDPHEPPETSSWEIRELSSEKGRKYLEDLFNVYKVLPIKFKLHAQGNIRAKLSFLDIFNREDEEDGWTNKENILRPPFRPVEYAGDLVSGAINMITSSMRFVDRIREERARVEYYRDMQRMRQISQRERAQRDESMAEIISLMSQTTGNLSTEDIRQLASDLFGSSDQALRNLRDSLSAMNNSQGDDQPLEEENED